MLNDRNQTLFKKVTRLEKERREKQEEIDNIEADIETTTYLLAKGFEESGEVEDLPTVSMVDEGLTATLKIETQYNVPKENKPDLINVFETDPTFAGIIYKTWSFNKLNSHLNEMLRQDGKLPDSIEEKVKPFTKYKVGFRKMTDKQRDNLKKKNIL